MDKLLMDYVPKNRRKNLRRLFTAHYYFIGLDYLNLGIQVCWSLPKIEIYVPFGFFRIGWVWDNIVPRSPHTPMHDFIARRTFGLRWAPRAA